MTNPHCQSVLAYLWQSMLSTPFMTSHVQPKSHLASEMPSQEQLTVSWPRRTPCKEKLSLIRLLRVISRNGMLSRPCTQASFPSSTFLTPAPDTCFAAHAVEPSLLSHAVADEPVSDAVLQCCQQANNVGTSAVTVPIRQ